MNLIFDAVLDNRIAEVEYLIDEGYDVNQLDDTGQNYPLIQAAYDNRLELVELLLKAGANAAVCGQNQNRTALYWAEKNQNKVMIDIINQYIALNNTAVTVLAESREVSGLFNFIDENIQLLDFSFQPLSSSLNGYVFNESLTAENRVPSLLPDFNLVKEDLVIDHYIRRDNLFFSDNECIARYSAIYHNDVSHLVVEAYLNAQGQFIYFEANKRRINKSSIDESITTEFALTAKQEKLISQQALSYQMVFKSIIKTYYSKIYSLYNTLINLDGHYKIGLAINKEFESEDHDLNHLIKISQQITNYDLPHNQDTRTKQYIQLQDRLIASRKNNKNPSKNKAIKSNVSLYQLVGQIKNLQEELTSIYTANHLLESWQRVELIWPILNQLDNLFLIVNLQYNSKTTAALMKKLHKKMPVSITMIIEEFKTHVVAGHLEQVFFLYPIIGSQCNLFSVYESLILSMCFSVNTELCEKQIQVANYFYEQSNVYRAFSYNFSPILFSPPKKKINTGLLYHIIENCNVAGFEMLLNHGFQLNTPPQSCGGMILDTLQLAIIQYKRPEQLYFIYKLMPQASSKNDALSFAMHYTNYIENPELIDALSTQAELSVLLNETAKQLAANGYHSSYRLNHDNLPSEMYVSTKQYISSANGVILFYHPSLVSSKAHLKQLKIVDTLLENLISRVSDLPLDSQENLISNLMVRSQSHQEQQKYCLAMHLQSLAQVIYLIADKFQSSTQSVKFFASFSKLILPNAQTMSEPTGYQEQTSTALSCQPSLVNQSMFKHKHKGPKITNINLQKNESSEMDYY